MKKILLSTASTLFVVSVLFTGCSSKEEPTKEELAKASEAVYVDPEYQGAPKWVLQPEMAGFVAETGSAGKNAGNDRSFQRTEAMADARNNLARQISISVDNITKSHKASTGTGADATFDSTSDATSKQIASETLKNTVVKDTWFSRTGVLHVLMVIDTSLVVTATEDAIKTSFKNDRALYQKFLGAKAQDELAQELEKRKEK